MKKSRSSWGNYVFFRHLHVKGFFGYLVKIILNYSSVKKDLRKFKKIV